MVSGSPVASGSTSNTSGWVTLGVSAGQQLLNLANSSTNATDPERFAKAQAWYSAAIQGDAVALCTLKYMGGIRGCAPGGCGGAQTCGFATAIAKQYTEVLYQKALGVLSGAISPGEPLPPSPAPSSNPLLPPSITGPAGQAADELARQRMRDALLSALPWVAVAVAAGVVLLVVIVKRMRG